MALLLAACDPLVDLEDTSGADSTSTGSADGGGVSGGPGSVPPNPTTPVTTSPGTGGGCTPGTFETCVCPDGYQGAQECGPSGSYLPCECENYESSTSGWDSWGSSGGWWGSSSSGWGSTSTGYDPDVYIPELPPGETCLPPELPCEGQFEVDSNAELMQMSICSVVAGDVFITGNVGDVATLTCLREVWQGFAVFESELSTVHVPALETAGEFAVIINPSVQSISAPALQSVSQLLIAENESVTSVSLPSLVSAEFIDVFGNAMLPDCTVVDIAAQSGNPPLYCEYNLVDMCTPMCG